jgi:hypothetical protein
VISLCIGRMGQGKSTIAYHIALQADTRVIVDPREQFHTTSDVIPDGETLFELLDEREEIIVRPYLDVEESFASAMDETCSWIRSNPLEKIAVLADEARILKLTDVEYPSFDWIVRSAGRESIDVIITAHRPSDIPVNIRAIAHYWFVFHTTQEHDLKVIAERAGDEAAEAVRLLRDRNVLVWNDSIGSWRIHTKPQTWYYDLAKLTPKKFPQLTATYPF